MINDVYISWANTQFIKMYTTEEKRNQSSSRSCGLGGGRRRERKGKESEMHGNGSEAVAVFRFSAADIHARGVNRTYRTMSEISQRAL